MLLAPPAAARALPHLRPLLVRLRAGEARRGLLPRVQLDTRLRRDQWGDWCNRKKLDRYESAICDKVERALSSAAHWTLVKANNKLHAWVKVLKTVANAIEKALV